MSKVQEVRIQNMGVSLCDGRRENVMAEKEREVM